MKFTSRKYKYDADELELEENIFASHTINKYNVAGQKEYWYFRRNTIRKKDKELSPTDYRRIVKAIYEAVKELMMEYEGGVFLKRYGYFSFLIKAYAKNKGFKNKHYYDSLEHTDGYQYIPILDTDVTTVSCINKMIMDRNYNQKTKQEFWTKIRDEGFRPKNYYTTLKSLYAHGNAKI